MGQIPICGNNKNVLEADMECVPTCDEGYEPEDATPFVCVTGKESAKNALQPPPLNLALTTKRDKPFATFTCVKRMCDAVAQSEDLEGCEEQLTYGEECSMKCKDSSKVMIPESYTVRCDKSGLVTSTDDVVRCEKKPCEAIRDVTSYGDEDAEERIFCSDPDQECILSCKEGWKLPSKLEGKRVCGEDSTWNDVMNNKYECERRTCEKLDKDEFKGCDNTVEFGAECSVTCAKESYHMVAMEEDVDTELESTQYKCECSSSSCELEPVKETRCMPKPCPKIPDKTEYKSQSPEVAACEETEVGENCELRCLEPEFELPSEVAEHTQRRCVDTSTWSPPLESLVCVKRKCEAVLSLGCTPTPLGETCSVKCSGAEEILVSQGTEVTGEIQLMCECEDETCDSRLFKSDTYVFFFTRIQLVEP